jgi:hypothetical protein
MNFSRRGTPGTDDADMITAFGKTYDEQTACKIMANQQLTFLLRGVIRIVENTGERIGEYARCILERDSVLVKVRGCLA